MVILVQNTVHREWERKRGKRVDIGCESEGSTGLSSVV